MERFYANQLLYLVKQTSTLHQELDTWYIRDFRCHYMTNNAIGANEPLIKFTRSNINLTASFY